MSEDFKESIVMLPHCGNCGHLFRLDEVAIVEDVYNSLHAYAKTEAILPCRCPKCNSCIKSIIMHTSEYFKKNGELYRTND